MKKTIIIGIIISILVIGLVSAENLSDNISINDTEDLNTNETINRTEDVELCNYIIERANIPVGKKIPGFLIQYRNARVNVYTKENESLGNLIINKGHVAEYECKLIEDPDYNVYINGRKTIDAILDSDSRVKALRDKINSGDIKIEGTSFGRKINSFITKIGINIASLFP